MDGDNKYRSSMTNGYSGRLGVSGYFSANGNGELDFSNTQMDGDGFYFSVFLTKSIWRHYGLVF